MRILSVGLFLSLIICTQAASQNLSLEASFVVQQMNGDHSYFDNDDGSTTKIEVQDFMAYGLQTGLNIGKFNMGLDFLFGESEVLSDNNFDTKVSCVDIDFEYSFLNKPISPLLVAGIGSVTYSDSFTSVENLNESDFSYNAGVGIKWVISSKIYVKPLYRVTRSTIKYTTGALTYNGISIGVGYIFTPKIYQ